MNFLNPAGLLAGLLAIPILALYLLRLRRKEISISSVYLWSQVLADREANTPWQRLRRNLLLFLQLGILTMLVLSLARPALPVSAVTAGSAAILLDLTASMNTNEGSGTRLELAIDHARDVVETIPDDGAASLILVGPQPRLLVPPTQDRGVLLDALTGIQAAHGEGDWHGAFSLAAGAMRAMPGSPTAVLLSDGGVPPGDYPPLPGELRFVSVGRSRENVGLEALSARSTGEQTELFVRVTNYGDLPHEAEIVVRADGALIAARRVSLAPGESRGETFSGLPEGSETYQAQLTPTAGDGALLDPFSLDDTGYLVLRTPTTPRALLVTEGNFFLEQLLAAMPDLEAFRGLSDEAGELVLPDPRFDAYILDRLSPTPLPPGNLLLIAPQGGGLLQVNGVLEEDLAPGRIQEHPLTADLDWSGVSIARALDLTAPPWADVLVSTQDHPLVLAGERGGRRIAVLAFSLQDSNLPLRLAFPVLFTNLLEYLTDATPPVFQEPLSPGNPVQVVPQETWTSAFLRNPAGETLTWPDPSGQSIEFTPKEVGLYVFRVETTGGTERHQAALNLFSRVESDIRPRTSLALGSAIQTNQAGAVQGQREIWPPLAALALAMLGLEWWFSHRSPSGQVQKDPYTLSRTRRQL